MQNIKNELINVFKNILENKEQSKNNYKIFDESVSWQAIDDYINKLNLDTSKIKNIKYFLIYADCTKEEEKFFSEVLSIFNVFENSEYFDIPLEIYTHIKSNPLYTSVINKLSNKVRNIKSLKEKLLLIEEQIRKIDEFIDYFQKLDEYHYIENIDFINAYLFEDRNIDLKIKINISQLLIRYNMKVSILINEKYKKDITNMIKEYKLSDEELSQVFAEYGYNFYLVPDEIKEVIKLNGVIEDIQYVFDFYKDLEIKFIENSPYHKVYLYILYKSNKTIIESLKKYANENDIDIKELLDKTPSVFMHKASDKRKGNGEFGESESTLICGSFEDFIKNIELFKSLGYPIYESYCKCSSVFVYSNKRLKENVDALKNYGIDISNLHGFIKLSGLKGTNILQVLDRFIELGESDYLFANTSRLALEPDSVIFHRLYFVKKFNRENPERQIEYKTVHKNRGITYKSFITIYDDDTLGIDGLNKNSFNETIKPQIFTDDIERELNSIINNNDSAEIDSSVLNTSEIKFMDGNYKVSDIVYEVAGMSFSRLKVLRLFSQLLSVNLDEDKLLLYCLTYNSLLTFDEFEIIIKDMDNKKKGFNK